MSEVPCLLLQPADDRLVPKSCQEGMRRHFHSFSVVPVEGPHFLLQARPSDAAGEIVKIIGEYCGAV